MSCGKNGKITMNRILNFFKSFIRHLFRGMPKSSNELILSRYNECVKCSSFDTINSQCLECGCNISQEKIFLNKLAWKDQKCPLGNW
jgi:hypothetical protein